MGSVLELLSKGSPYKVSMVYQRSIDLTLKLILDTSKEMCN